MNGQIAHEKMCNITEAMNATMSEVLLHTHLYGCDKKKKD